MKFPKLQQATEVPAELPEHSREVFYVAYLLSHLPTEIVRQIGTQILQEYPDLKTAVPHS